MRSEDSYANVSRTLATTGSRDSFNAQTITVQIAGVQALLSNDELSYMTVTDCP